MKIIGLLLVSASRNYVWKESKLSHRAEMIDLQTRQPSSPHNSLTALWQKDEKTQLLQILTLAEIFQGLRPDLPHIDSPYKKAQRSSKPDTQGKLL